MPQATFRTRGPLDLRLTLGPLVHGAADPTIRVTRTAAVRATRNADGPAATWLTLNEDEIRVEAWGPGAERALADVSALIGLLDDPDPLPTAHPLVTALRRRFAGLRIGRTGAVLESLVPAILEQKVTGTEAHRAWRMVVRRHGEAAPGPLDLWLPPEPTRLASLPYHAFHPLGVEQRRADTVRRAALRTAWLEAAVALPVDEAYGRLRSIPGVGAWTAAEVGLRALGDRDAVSVGDFHLKHLVSWALAGEPRGTDERMLELLEPYRGQRALVVRLLEASGIAAPRFGPRVAPRAIAGI